jgi:hypothetical protein
MFDRRANKFLWALLAFGLAVQGADLHAAEAASKAAAWQGVSGPARVAAGQTFEVRVRLMNTSGTLWEARGARRVVLAAMVVDGHGNPWPMPEARSRLMYPAPPGAATTGVIAITAPGTPGSYRVLIGRGEVEKGAFRLDTGPSVEWKFEVETGTEKPRH